MEITHIIKTSAMNVIAIEYTGTPDSIDKIKEHNKDREIYVKPDGNLEFRRENDIGILRKGDYNLTNPTTNMSIGCPADVFRDWMKINKFLSNTI